MTLMDFKLHMRPEKEARGRSMFRKNQVSKLKTEGEIWEAKIKLGLYKVLVDVDVLKLDRSSCK